jgi:hypothetical protein
VFSVFVFFFIRRQKLAQTVRFERACAANENASLEGEARARDNIS